jgi:pyruvate,orthophosphate dikinase
VSYVSASPHRIPIAIVAAAQAKILNKNTPKSSKKKRHQNKKSKKKSHK